MGKYIFLTLVMMTTFSIGQEKMIFHVTKSSGGFSTEILMRNTFAVNLPYNLMAYDADGHMVAQVEGILEPLSTRKIDNQDLFGVSGVSHFKKSEDTLISFHVAYQGLSQGAGIAHVAESNQSSKEWILFPGSPDLTWDGFAVVNHGVTSASITVSQFDDEFKLMQTMEIHTALNLNGKALYVLSSDFDLSPDRTHFVIHSDQSIGVIALRGTNDNSTLWENLAFPVSSETNSKLKDDVTHEGGILHITNSTGGFNTSNAMINKTSTEVTITLEGTYPDPPGGHTEVTKTIPPGGGLYFLSTQDLFPDRTVTINGEEVTQRVSYIRVPSSKAMVTATYLKEGSAPVVVKPSVEEGCGGGIVSIHQYNGSSDYTFGMAYINTHTSSVTLGVVYKNEDGQTIKTEIIQNDGEERLLGPNQKRLHLFKPPEGTSSWIVLVRPEDDSEMKDVKGAYIGLTFSEDGEIIMPSPDENICDVAPAFEEITHMETQVEGLGSASHYSNGESQIIEGDGSSGEISYGPSTVSMSVDNTTCFLVNFTNGPMAGQTITMCFLWADLCNGWFLTIDAFGNFGLTNLPFTVTDGLGCF